MSYVKNYIGQKFGRLLVLEKFRSNNRTYYKCKCDCGKYIVTRDCHLTNKKTKIKSCGCYTRELAKYTNKRSKSWTGYKMMPGRYWSSLLNGGQK